MSDGNKMAYEFPEMARKHLRRLPAEGDHPDAGLLTALVEGTLARTHRDYVFSHLAACSECNRLVAMIAPESDAIRALQPAALRHRWFAWRPLPWAGAATAAVAILVTAAFLGRNGQPTRTPAPPVIAAVEKAPSSGTPAHIPVAQPDAPRPVYRAAKPAQSARPLPQPAPSQPSLPPADAVVAAQSRPAAPGDVRGQTAFQTSMISDAGAWPEATSSENQPPALKTEPAPLTAANIPPVPVQPAGPLWSVSETGALQKSNDNGQTWAAVALPARVPMHAVSVSGQDIWTGGDHGSLFHSTDAGQSWIAVTPTLSSGAVLSDDIMRIVFSGGNHGWIATRKSELWTTRDGGATWVRR